MGMDGQLRAPLCKGNLLFLLEWANAFTDLHEASTEPILLHPNWGKAGKSWPKSGTAVPAGNRAFFFPPCWLRTHFLHLHGAVLLCVPSPPHTAHGDSDLPFGCSHIPVGISSLLQAQVITVPAVSSWFQRFWLCHVTWRHQDGWEKPPQGRIFFPCHSQVTVVPGSPLCVRAGRITSITTVRTSLVTQAPLLLEML